MSILEKFTVVDLIKTRSESVVTIQGNTLKFNRQTAGELHYASHIQVLINQKGKQFAIRACKEDAPNAIPFSKPEGEQKYKISVTIAAVTDLIRKMAEWSADDNWNIPGAYFADDEALVYDIRAAVKPGPPKAGWTAKRQKEAEAAADGEEADN
jgi:hypothetical protein